MSVIRYAPTVVLGAVVAARAAAASSGYVATIHPLAAILRELVPDATRVQALLPPGASPHTFEPRPSDLRAAQSAGALFFVSSEFDGWAARLPARRTIAVLDRVPPEHRLPSAPGSKDSDPHFWTDPVAVKASLAGLTDVLCALEQADCEAVRNNAERFSVELERLDREVQEMLEPVHGSPVVLFHPSFRYFLRRYGLVLAGVIEPSPDRADRRVPRDSCRHRPASRPHARDDDVARERRWRIDRLIGLWASYVLDVPSGATIVLVQAALFFAAMPFRGRGV